MGFKPRFQNMCMNLMLVKQQTTHKTQRLWDQDSTPEINCMEQSDKDFEISVFRSSERQRHDFH